jgi:hypothetical protein
LIEDTLITCTNDRLLLISLLFQRIICQGIGQILIHRIRLLPFLPSLLLVLCQAHRIGPGRRRRGLLLRLLLE